MEPNPFIVGVLTFAAIPFAVCFVLGLNGRVRGALRGAGIVVVLAVLIAVPLWMGDYEAGLAGLAILFFTAAVLVPPAVGALLGAGLGILIWYLLRSRR